jgi:hypothetical protein
VYAKIEVVAALLIAPLSTLLSFSAVDPIPVIKNIQTFFSNQQHCCNVGQKNLVLFQISNHLPLIAQ